MLVDDRLLSRRGAGGGGGGGGAGGKCKHENGCRFTVSGLCVFWCVCESSRAFEWKEANLAE